MKLVVAALALIVMISTACTSTAIDTPQLEHATARIGRLSLTVTNEGQVAWTAMRVTIRTKAGGTAYRRTVGELGPGQRAEVNFVDCVNRDGERFSPLTMSVHHFTVDAEVNGVESSVTFVGNQ